MKCGSGTHRYASTIERVESAAPTRNRARMANSPIPVSKEDNHMVPTINPATHPIPPTFEKSPSRWAHSDLLNDSSMSTVPTGAAAVDSAPIMKLANR